MKDAPDSTATAGASPRAKSRSLKTWWLVAAVAIAAVISLAAADELIYADRILPGVHVGPVSVGGMTRADATRLLERRLSRSRVLRIVWLGGTKDVDVRGVDFGIDPAAAAESAYYAGRTGDLVVRLDGRLTAIADGLRVDVDATPTGTAQRVLAAAREILAKPAIDAHFELVNGKVRTVRSRPGHKLNNRGAAIELADAFLADRKSVYLPTIYIEPKATTVMAIRLRDEAAAWAAGPFLLRLGTRGVTISPSSLLDMTVIESSRLVIEPARLAGRIRRVAIAVRRQPTSARFRVAGGRVQILGGTVGRAVDVSLTAGRVATALNGRTRTASGVMRAIQPAVTRQDLAQLGIKWLLSSFTTVFRPGLDGRDINISLSARAVRGKALAPGQVFSLNDATGPRNAATGYKESLGFLNGKVVPTVGGGTCQVSSTLYEAALLANLRVISRNSHSMAVSYLPPGRDATTYYPTIDLKFQNNRSTAVLLWSTVRGHRLTIQVYGSGPRPKVTIRTVVRKTIAPKKSLVYTSRLKRGARQVEVDGQPGYVVTSYRFVWQGKRLVQREFLATDRYRPKNSVILVGS